MGHQRWKAAVVTLSDKGYIGEREDKSGPLICEMLKNAGYDIHENSAFFQMTKKKLKSVYINYVMA